MVEENIINDLSNKNLFVVEKSNISSLRIGGRSDCHRFITNKNKYEEKEYYVLEGLRDDNRYYFKPIFSDEVILINSEDYYMYNDKLDDLGLGEIKTSNNRELLSLKYPYKDLYSYLDSDYIYDNIYLVLNNPLTVSLNDIVELDSVINKDMILEYNISFKNELNRELKRMKINAFNNLINDYDYLDCVKKEYVKLK